MRRQNRRPSPPKPRPRPPTSGAPAALWPLLARLAILFVAALVLWWFALLDPLLAVFRFTSSVPLRVFAGAAISTDSAANWIVETPVTLPKREPLAGVTSPTVQLGVRRAILTRCTLCFPLLWALMLAAPWSRRTAWALLYGTAAVALVAQLSILAKILSIFNEYFVVASSSAGGFLIQLLEYLAVNILPEVAPVLAALWLHPDLRSLVSAESTARTPPAPKA